MFIHSFFMDFLLFRIYNDIRIDWGVIMNVNDFDYELPKELIAQTPLKVRDASRLLHRLKIWYNIPHEKTN